MPRPVFALLFILLAGTAQAQISALPPKAAEINALLRKNELDPAVAKGEAWTATEPSSAAAWFWLGRAYAREAMSSSILTKASWASKTRNAYEKAVALDATHIDARHELMQYYVMAPGFMGGDEEKARQQAQAIAALDAARGHIANALLAQVTAKDEAAAEREYRAAYALKPDEPRMRLALAAFLASKKRWAEVRALFDAALAKNPDDASAHYQLGRSAALSGEELESGLAHLDTYLELPHGDEDPSAGAANWRRGQILDKLGRKDRALVALRTAVQADPSLEDAKKDLKRLGG